MFSCINSFSKRKEKQPKIDKNDCIIVFQDRKKTKIRPSLQVYYHFIFHISPYLFKVDSLYSILCGSRRFVIYRSI